MSSSNRGMKENQGSVGLVQRKILAFAAPPDEMVLESGARLGPVTLAYETCGCLDSQRKNAILILHALSGDAHVAGYHTPDDPKPGWWDWMVGPGRPFDTDRYFIICSNVIGGCQGSTGPRSINPATGKPYNLDFPVVTIGDMVEAQRHLIDALGIDRLLCVTGGSMGGMQALEWAIRYPSRVASAIPIATSCSLSAQGIAFNEVGRRAITADSRWQGGNYGPNPYEIPAAGLAVARMLAHITYLSEQAMQAKFGRRLRAKDRYGYDFSIDFEVESYLHHQGESFVRRFDANSYLYISKAMDYFDLYRQYGSLEQAFAAVQARFLLLSFTSDWLFPTPCSNEIAQALLTKEKEVTLREISLPYGHDSFLIENDEMKHIVSAFLARIYAAL
ncbi:MAG TPA: homoserine O-acetyltransferase [bacterium]|nr:homoserine O-acetyltransferase [bacterium]HPG44375.1 homoserine O-acetyltransferase [bacterium]